MTAWSFPQRSGPLTELDAAECRRLLASTSVGRLGYVTETGPRIVPVNYTVLSDRIAFRTITDGEIARYGLGHPVAFEVDEFDEFLHSGWSVLLTGQLREMAPDVVRSISARDTPEPWPDRDQTLLCELDLTTPTGRRVYGG